MKYVFPIWLFLLITLSSEAQNFYGISSSNYAGTHAVALNPANAVDSKYSLFINFAGMGIDIQNNYAKWNAPYSLLRLSTKTVGKQYLSPTSGLAIWKLDYYKLNKNLDKVKAYINTEVRGPAFQLSFPKKAFGIAVGVNYRMLNSLPSSY